MTDDQPPAATWGACRFCGIATPSGASQCAICGAADPLPAAQLATAPRSVRRRLAFLGVFRSVIVIVVVAALAYAIVSAELSGPPVLSGDPLTTAGTYVIGPGNYTFLEGEINGGDYVLGNFSSVAPAGTDVALAVYNTSDWDAFVAHDPTVPVYSMDPTYAGSIAFSPLVTDNYWFVFTNPYAPSSHLTVTVYITTEYEANSGDDGFA